MTLPNYFLADLPPDAELSPAMVTEACQSLKRNREMYLLNRSTASIAKAIADLAASWLKSDFNFRQMIFEVGPAEIGFSAATMARGLDAFYAQLTADKIELFLVQELAHSERLDRLVASEIEQRQQRSAIACGPELIAHITAGNIPTAALSAMVLGLLARSAQFCKLSRGAGLIPRLFAHSLYQAEPKLGACLELAEWHGGHAALEEALFAEADCVTATGSDETLEAIRKQVPASKRFLGYGHRVSFAFIAKDALMPHELSTLSAKVVADIAAWNQQGCLSPHVVYVEKGGRIKPDELAEQLALDLERIEQKEPRGPVSVLESAAIATRRAFYEVRAAASGDTRLWTSRESTTWTVVYESDPQFSVSCLNRFIYVKPVEHLTEALQAADRVRGKVSTVALAAPALQAQVMVAQLARWGVTRVCPLGQMQSPPLHWRHDGRPALADLLTWTDWEY
jgi:hypothetical protein